MKKTFYYTLNEQLITVYLIDGNIPRGIVNFYTYNNNDLDEKVRLYLIENDYYCEGSKIQRL